VTSEPRVPAAGDRTGDDAELSAPSFSKPLFTGAIAADLVFPFHRLARDEQRQVEQLTADLRDWAAEHYDAYEVEERGWIGDDTVAALGEMGMLGLYVPTELGGRGLSQTAYCRVFEEIGQIDPTLGTVLGVHQSIGYKGIVLHGSEEQQERYLPDLAAGRALAGFALTEPNAGSDAYHLESWAERRADGNWVLNGEKRYIGNGARDVIVTFARSDEGHVAFILEGGMDGFEAGPRHDTMGLRGNDLRPLTFRDVVVPPENVLGEPGEGFEIAMSVLNNGRMSLGSGAVGGTKRLIDLTIDRVTSREQFGQPIGDFELVEEKVSWMISYLFGLESMVYATTGMVDRGVPDYSIESAMIKVAASEFLWYAANRAFQLAGGTAYMRDQPYEKILRDIRVFPIFEGANDVLRAFIALTGLQALGDALPDVSGFDVRDPIATIGVVVDVADYLVDRVGGRIRPDRRRIPGVHEELGDLAEPIGEQARHLRATAERLLRQHGRDIRYRQWQQKRLAHAALDVYAQVCTLARVTAIFEERGGADLSGQERYIAETFCTRARNRVHRQLDRVDDNDDDRMHAIARIAYERGSYGFDLFNV
jgi:acyl-CoA dehydrogenase family member 9